MKEILCHKPTGTPFPISLGKEKNALSSPFMYHFLYYGFISYMKKVRVNYKFFKGRKKNPEF